MKRQLTATLLALAMALPLGAMAQDSSGALVVELNRVVPLDNACRLTFLAQNNMDRDVASIVFETVLFDTSGGVERLTLFDLGDLPTARPRVREFDMAGLACADLGRILFNGVDACEGEGVDPETCQAALSPVSRVDGVEVIG
ncbi:hypothetical protein [Gymnodinialimonas ceratoperidinii]|uniref:Tat pathway signal sequence domain protein n=1 Tax=Gymnodinialimonas ceratoperidinii TaxID=2856823 RepID=A0A8F6TU19_9RHOB|nr:hypothetical protein [Gymnodinialimonas ceratoperidinii]QXT38952.1 hypothetical protein KYE46_13565 [Gymnodinialimonas ceratoperidinii]